VSNLQQAQDTKKTDNTVEEIKKFFNHDLENEEIWLGDYKFKLNPDACLPPVSDKILDQVSLYEEFIKTNPSTGEKIKFSKNNVKAICGLGLTAFNWDDAYKKLGYGKLEKLSSFLFFYHVESGGKEGFRLWQTQLNLTLMSRSSGIKD